MIRLRRVLFPILASGSLVLGGAGCSTVNYYTQAMCGQSEILSKARPIKSVLRDPGVSNDVKRKLELAGVVTRFAKEHWDLPTDGRYDRYTDLHRRYVTWVVFAAPEFSVEGKPWWYPVVGSLKYRGYFSEAAAREEAASLKAKGLDVYAGGVEAYSTLGWFHDPILNTFFRTSDAEFAELLFHELTHVKLFIPGDTDFNEAFATANAEIVVRHWLQSKGDSCELAEYEAALGKDRQIVELLLRTRERLRQLYAESSKPPVQLRIEKAAIFEEMRREYVHLSSQWRGKSRYDRTFAKPWNNARLNTVATYYDLVPGLERMFKENGADPERFYAAVSAMRHLSKDERRAALMR